MRGVKGKPKKRRSRIKPDNPAQSRKFIEAAKALGLDKPGKTLDSAMDKVLKPKAKRGRS